MKWLSAGEYSKTNSDDTFRLFSGYKSLKDLSDVDLPKSVSSVRMTVPFMVVPASAIPMFRAK